MILLEIRKAAKRERVASLLYCDALAHSVAEMIAEEVRMICPCLVYGVHEY
jgi:uncharacterized membrane protein